MNNSNEMNQEDGESIEILDAIRKQYAANGVNVSEPTLDTSSTNPDDEDDHVHADHEKAAETKPLAVPTPPEARYENHDVKKNKSLTMGTPQPRKQKHGNTIANEPTADLESGVVVGIPHTGTEAQPGAFAEAVEGDRPPPTSTNESQLVPQPAPLDMEGMPVANQVDVEGQSNLQQAESMDGYTTARNAEGKPLQSILNRGGGLCLVVGIVLLIVLLLTRNERAETDPDDIGNPEPTLSPTEAPTLSPLMMMENRVLSLFPNYTIEAMEDAESPQSKAMAWLMKDPNLESYIDLDWRIRQRFALATFYYSNGGSQWDIHDRWLAYDAHECTWWSRPWFAPPSPGMFFLEVEHSNPCEWENVSVPILKDLEENAEYKHLWLLKNALKGSIPEEIFWLTSLRSFSLSLNPLYGTISTRFGLLPRLEALTLSRNEIGLAGTLPTELGVLSKLSVLSVMGNKLTGNIEVLGRLPVLSMVMVDWNKFTGSIPSELGTIKTLERLYLDVNALTGTLPTELGELDGLIHLFVDDNQLIGMIPSELGRLRSLKRLSLKNNSFTGTLCTELGLLSTVLPFELQDNQFRGPLPSELGLLTSMIQFLAQNNDLTGSIPSEMSLLLGSNTRAASLLALNLTNNPLAEDLPPDAECWVNSTFFEGGLCDDYPSRFLATSCDCDCSCS